MDSSTKQDSKPLTVHLDNLAVPEVRCRNKENLNTDEDDSEEVADINYQCAVPEFRRKNRAKENK